MPPRRTAHRPRRGFSMVEALLGIGITTIAGAALLTSLGGAVRSATDGAHAAIARGMAEQLMDEIAAARFPLTPSPPSGSTRSGFDDIDDYDGWTECPPSDRAGHVLGTEGAAGSGVLRPDAMRPDGEFLSRFTRTVAVERVEPSSDGGWTVTTQPTDYRRVRVRVLWTDANNQTTPMAELTRIFSHVAITP